MSPETGSEATQDVAGVLAGMTLPLIEPFGSDNPALANLPGYAPVLATGEQLPSRVGVAREVYDGTIASLVALKRLEDSLAACKAALVARLMGAAQVEAAAVRLNPWQHGVAHSSACTDLALTLCIPEVTAASLAHHSTVLVNDHPLILDGVHAGLLSFRHACIIVDEIATLEENPLITAADAAAFEARLLEIAPGTTAASFAGKARRVRESTHPETITTRTKQAYSKRAMTLESGKDGMSWLTLHLPSLAAEGIWVNCTRTARAIKNQARLNHPPQNSTTGARPGAAGGGHDGSGGRDGSGGGEYRTLTQLRIDVAAALLLNQHPLTAEVRKTNNTTKGDAGHGFTTDSHGTSNSTSTSPTDTATSTGANENTSTDAPAGPGPDVGVGVSLVVGQRLVFL
nr:DUF222 domain-containing protein [Arthrobacter polaris]UIK89627.1 DUF222 domain-containing protein [Arthrobacter polaris]